MPEPSHASTSPQARTQRQSLGLIDRPCTEGELLQYLIEGAAVRDELDQQARQLVSLAERSAAAACRPAVTAFEDRKSFLNSLGREIQAPLNSILAMTEVLRSKQLPKPARECVEEMSQSGAALRSIIDDLLDFGKIESGKIDIQQGDVEIASLLAESVQIVRKAATRKFLTIRTYVDPALPQVITADAGRVRQVLLNLLNNAIRLTFQGEIELRAQLRTTPRNRPEIYFSVKDNGASVTPQQQVALFQPFGQSGGGLGLAICKHLAELMGGSIGVTSSPGSGSLFWFTIGAQPSAN
jgi:two-component system, sensor histidine kinase and response regulator